MCFKNYLDVVELLINYSVKVNLLNGEKILFIIVCVMKNVYVVNMLIKVGVSVNLVDNEKGIFFIIVCVMDDL